MSAIKFKVGMPTEVTLSYDSPKTGTNSYGEWYLYGIKSDISDENDGFFATSTLHTMIQTLGAKEGSNLKIEKCSDGEITFFKVNGLTLDDINKGKASSIKEEAKPNTSKPSFEQEIKEIKERLNVLERDKLEIPF